MNLLSLSPRDPSWSDDPLARSRQTARAAQGVAAAALLVAGLEAVALAAMGPLKTVVPYTVTVDRQTGYVELLKGIEPGKLTQDQAVAQSAIVQYVIARESFDATDLRENYRKATLWSDGDARGQYLRDMQKSNPASPLNQYTPNTTLSVVVKSVSLLSPGSALVRFDTIRRDNGAAGGEQRAWTAVLAFRYAGAPMRMEDRFTNPLGFQVTRYRRDAETTAPTPVRFEGALGRPVS